MTKQWALLRNTETGAFSIAADRGDYAWNSPILHLLAYFDSHYQARVAARLAQNMTPAELAEEFGAGFVSA